jgi:hypothetical protein
VKRMLTSHLSVISRPDQVTKLILDAARSVH